MATGELDIDKLQRQLAILMTNSTEFQSKMYDIFVSTTPMDVEVKVWTGDNTFETIKVPNRAKGNIPAQLGQSDPEGSVEASYGTIYFNESNGKVFIKTTLSDVVGWQEIITATAMKYHDEFDETAHEKTLAKIHGDAHTHFQVADITADSDDSYAVNKGSLYGLLGGLERLKTWDKSTTVSAINELVDLTSADTATVVHVDPASALDSISNKSRLMAVESAGENGCRIKIIKSFEVVDCLGMRRVLPEGMSLSSDAFISSEDVLRESNKFSVYVSFEVEDAPELVALPGDYFISAHRPYLMKENDVWLDIGNVPYNVQACEKVENSRGQRVLSLMDRNYVYLGTVEEVFN